MPEHPEDPTRKPSVTVDEVLDLGEHTKAARDALRAVWDARNAAIDALNQIHAWLEGLDLAKREDLDEYITYYRTIGTAVTKMANNIERASEASDLAIANLGIVSGYADGTFERVRRIRDPRGSGKVWEYQLTPQGKALAEARHGRAAAAKLRVVSNKDPEKRN